LRVPATTFTEQANDALSAAENIRFLPLSAFNAIPIIATMLPSSSIDKPAVSVAGMTVTR